MLDIGSAYGHFVKWVQERGFAATGCDISAIAVKWGRANFGISLINGTVHELNLPPASFDCIVALDWLYAAPDPAADLHAMRRLIRPGGHVILRLRNNFRLAVRARRQGNKTVGRPVLPVPHLWAFTPDSITVLLSRCGFRPVLCEAAAYSKTLLLPALQIGVRANRMLKHAPFHVAPLTKSFNVVARRLT